MLYMQKEEIEPNIIVDINWFILYFCLVPIEIQQKHSQGLYNEADQFL